MRWLRFAALGALVPLTLFALLASSVAPRGLGLFEPCISPVRVSIADRAEHGTVPVWWHGVICRFSLTPLEPPWSIPQHESPQQQRLAAPDLPFASAPFVPVIEPASLLGTDSRPRCVGERGRPIPIWPERAERLGIRKGWVLIEFDISETGVVENARVIDAAPQGLFEASALRAIGRWCYRPALQDGRVSVPAVKPLPSLATASYD